MDENTRLPRRGSMPLTLPWKGRCAVYQLIAAVATQMSHKLVYGADELYFLKALALVLWFSKGLISHERSSVFWCRQRSLTI